MANTFTTIDAAAAASDYGDIISYVRSLTFDMDEEAQRNSDASLKTYIRLVLPTISSVTAEFDSVNEVFSVELTETDKLRIAAESSMIIVSGMPTEFEYKNPFESAKRKWNQSNLLERIERLLSGIIGNRFAGADSHEVYKMLNSTSMMNEMVEESQQ